MKKKSTQKEGKQPIPQNTVNSKKWEFEYTKSKRQSKNVKSKSKENRII